jgi:DNA-binding IclR family transcriptional regulator/enamine deaminase RidA (YjgF/YER057c/UK114 family)
MQRITRTEQRRTPKNASVAKAFQILGVLGASRREMTATDVAQSLGTNLATVHRFLVTLEDLGAVARGPEGRFHLGLTLANLGSKVESHRLLVGHVQEHLDALAVDFREVAHCAVRNVDVAVNIARAQPERSLVMGFATGDTMPLHCSAVGKVLLASLEAAALNPLLDRLELEPRTARTITRRSQLAAELREIAARGYAVDDGELEEGLRSIALPVHNGRGTTVAAMALSAPVSRLDDRQLERARTAIRAHVERIEHALFTESRVFPQKARPRGPFPHLKRVDDFIFVSGTSARRPDDTFEGVRIAADGSVTIDIRRQTRAVFGNIQDMLSDVGLGLEAVIDVHAYLTDMADYDAFNEAYAEFFGFDGPTRTTVAVKELPHPHQRLMVRVVAYAAEGPLA